MNLDILESVGVSREAMTPARKEAFAAMAPANISLVSTYDIVSTTVWDVTGGVIKRLGHNRGLRPVRAVGRTTYKDTATTEYNKRHDVFQGTMFRVWTMVRAQRNQLLDAVVDMIAEKAEHDGCGHKLINEFDDVGPDLNMRTFERDVHRLALQLGIATWDDTELIGFLDRAHERSLSISARGRGGRFSPIEVAISMEFDDWRAKVTTLDLAQRFPDADQSLSDAITDALKGGAR